MVETSLLVLTCLLAASGFALIAVSQKQHRRLINPTVVSLSPTVLRLCGALLIVVATVPAVVRDGWAFGLLLWVTILTVAALLVVVWLSKRRDQAGGQRESR